MYYFIIIYENNIFCIRQITKCLFFRFLCGSSEELFFAIVIGLEFTPNTAKVIGTDGSSNISCEMRFASVRTAG
jgi:hypothetical protein